MGIVFWIRRFLTALLVAAVIIGIAQWIKTQDLNHALTQAAIWGPLTAAVFTGTAFFRARRCAVCETLPKQGPDSST